MREYGQIQSSYWQTASEEVWSDDAKIIGAYLLTGPHTNGLGCFRLPAAYIADDFGWSMKRIEATFKELSRHEFCERYGAVILIPKFLRWNKIVNPRVAKARENEFDALTNQEAKRAAAERMLEYGKHWRQEFRTRLESISERVPKSLQNQFNNPA